MAVNSDVCARMAVNPMYHNNGPLARLAACHTAAHAAESATGSMEESFFGGSVAFTLASNALGDALNV